MAGRLFYSFGHRLFCCTENLGFVASVFHVLPRELFTWEEFVSVLGTGLDTFILRSLILVAGTLLIFRHSNLLFDPVLLFIDNQIDNCIWGNSMLVAERIGCLLQITVYFLIHKFIQRLPEILEYTAVFISDGGESVSNLLGCLVRLFA